MPQTLSLEDVVRQSVGCHPDWTPRDHAEYLYTEEMAQHNAMTWQSCREAVARVLNVTPCHGLPWKRNDRTAPIFVTRGRMAMSQVEDCPADGCSFMRPFGSTWLAD